MSVLWWILIFSLVGGVLSVLAAAGLLLLPKNAADRLVPHLVSYAIGALLGAAFLGLLPHALEAPGLADPHRLGMVVLLGILGFFLLEKLVLWRHCHEHSCDAHPRDEVPEHVVEHGRRRSRVALIVIGDGFHNFVDGVLIAAAFMTDIHLGVVTALAVATHEIPQELGDFAILLASGLSRSRALAYNLLSALTTLLGALLAWYSLGLARGALPYVLAVAAASFIYIAVADLIPGLHRRTHIRATVGQILLIAAGVATIWLTHSALH